MSWDTEDDDDPFHGRPWENDYDFDDEDVDDGLWDVPIEPARQQSIEVPITYEDQHENALQGVICPIHGRQGLTQINYFAQLSNPNNHWLCPVCGENSIYDDDRNSG